MKNKNDNPHRIQNELEKYFQRKAEDILNEVNSAATLTNHRHMYGVAGEESIRSVLDELFPGRYGIGTGHIVSGDAASQQVDLVIYDKEICFNIPINHQAALFSVEGICAAVEIVTSPSRSHFNKKTMEMAVSNMDSIMELVNPFSNSEVSNIPAYKNIQDSNYAKNTNLLAPVGAILLIGTGSRFKTITQHFREAQDQIDHWHHQTDLLCILDEENFGICGFEFINEGQKGIPKFWRDECDTVGETLSAFIYRLFRKISLGRRVENQAVWPSVLAPVVRCKENSS
jgi:hypothetical protein